VCVCVCVCVCVYNIICIYTQGVDAYLSKSLARNLLAHVMSAWCRMAQDQLILDERSALGAAHTLRALAASHRGAPGATSSKPVGIGGAVVLSLSTPVSLPVLQPVLQPVTPVSLPSSHFTPPPVVSSSVGSPPQRVSSSPHSGTKSPILSPESKTEEGGGWGSGGNLLARGRPATGRTSPVQLRVRPPTGRTSPELQQRVNDKVKSKLSSYRHLLNRTQTASAMTSRCSSEASTYDMDGDLPRSAKPKSDITHGTDSDSVESPDGVLDEEVSRILGDLRH
jgi:hypothetical protein